MRSEFLLSVVITSSNWEQPSSHGFQAIAPMIATCADSPTWIALFSSDVEPVLHHAAVPIWGREEGIVITGPSGNQLDGLAAQGIEPVFKAPDQGEAIHVLSHDRYFNPPVFIGVPRFEINDHTMLYLIPAGLEIDLPRLKLHALFHGVPRVSLPPVRVHVADAAALRTVALSEPRLSL